MESVIKAVEANIKDIEYAIKYHQEEANRHLKAGIDKQAELETCKKEYEDLKGKLV